MQIENRTRQDRSEIEALCSRISNHTSLGKVIAWGTAQPEGDVLRKIVADVIVQDEYSHDVIVPWKDGLLIVYGTT